MMCKNTDFNIQMMLIVITLIWVTNLSIVVAVSICLGSPKIKLIKMKVQLSRYFKPQDTHIKTLKQILKIRKQQKQKEKESTIEASSNIIEIIDPLKQQISFFRNSVSRSNDFTEGNAFKTLKQYVQQQDRQLKKIKLQRFEKSRQRRVKTEIDEPSISESQIVAEIPEAGDYFKNQKRDSLLYENRELRRQISDKISLIESSIREYSPAKSGSLFLKPVVAVETDIDRKLSRDKQRNNRLINKLERQKGRIKQLFSLKRQSQNYLDQPIKLQQPKVPVKKKIVLKGLKSVSLKIKDQTRRLSPSVALLFQLRNFSELKQRKEVQLGSMLKHQYYNRSHTMNQKDIYYSQKMSSKIISPSMQYKTRKIMDGKLTHRLKATKDQANHFKNLLKNLKDSRTIICQSLQSIFDDLRILVLSGKVLKQRDLEDIIDKYKDCGELKNSTNTNILKKVRAMMI